MGLMAAFASAQADGGVLEYKRPLLFDVTLKADLLAGETGPDLAHIDAAVRLVAVGAPHRVLAHPVMERL